MNPVRADQQHLLDLLVDGELDEAARRELLLWCERDPEGWRRCALAFLEAQCWSQQVGGLDAGDLNVGDLDDPQFDKLLAAAVQPPAGGGATPPASLQRDVRPAPRSQRTFAWKSFMGPLAMAASFLAAFGLGLLARNGWPTSGVSPLDRQVAQDDSAGQETNAAGELKNEVVPALPREPMGQVRLVVDGPDGSTDEIQLPVVEGRSLDADFLQSQPVAMPREMQRMLEQMGHQVRQRREMLPLRLKDGRRLIVPVDQVEVHPAANRDYQ